MFQSDCLTEEQKGVLEDLFSGTNTIREILEKRRVDRSEYSQWLTQESFYLEFNRMLELLRLESRLVLARYSSQIAAKMISLAMEEDSEVARQACMDVINHPDFKDKAADAKPQKDEQQNPIPPELASRLLNELADYQDSNNETKQADSPLF
jgi:hypothetical protein